MDTTKCEEACDQLDIRPSGKRFKNGRPCYKGGSGVCNQNGGFNRRASLICKQEDNEQGGGGMLRVTLPSPLKISENIFNETWLKGFHPRLNLLSFFYDINYFV